MNNTVWGIARVDDGWLEALNLSSDPPQWQRRGCPYVEGMKCGAWCALFWFNSRQILLGCSGVVVDILKEPRPQPEDQAEKA